MALACSLTVSVRILRSRRAPRHDLTWMVHTAAPKQPTERRHQLLLLFVAQKRDEFFGDGPLVASKPGPKKASEPCQSSNQNRPFRNAFQALEHFEQGIAAERVVHSPLTELVPYQIVGFPSVPVMVDFQLRKSFHLPSFHPRRCLRVPVFSSILKNGISSDRVVTLSAHQLRGVRDRIYPV